VAKRGTSKWFSELHERHVAKAYDGHRSASSGGAAHDRGDVRVRASNILIECKHKGSFDKPAKSVSVKLDDLEKIADEAWSESKDFRLALRMYAPDSVLADRDGFVDLEVKTLGDAG